MRTTLPDDIENYIHRIGALLDLLTCFLWCLANLEAVEVDAKTHVAHCVSRDAPQDASS